MLREGEVRYVWGLKATDYREASLECNGRGTFTGQRSRTVEFGLMYYYEVSLVKDNARWYDPSHNLFGQPDSIISDLYNPLDYNRYSYVRWNPIKYTDPTGHNPENIHTDSYFEYSTNYISLKVNYAAALGNNHGPGTQYIVPSNQYDAIYGSLADPRHFNLCGHLSLAAIYESVNGGNALPMIWEKYPTGPNDTSGGWSTFVNDNLPGWSAKQVWFNSWDVKNDITKVLSSGYYLILGCVIDEETGRLVDGIHFGEGGKYADHWVAVKGVNDYGITVYNPYTNNYEFNSWSEFKYRDDGNGRLVPDQSWGAAYAIKYVGESINDGQWY